VNRIIKSDLSHRRVLEIDFSLRESNWIESTDDTRSTLGLAVAYFMKHVPENITRNMTTIQVHVEQRKLQGSEDDRPSENNQYRR
jgi:hypothetical protein